MLFRSLFNTMPYINNPITIPIGILAPADGNYSITASGMESFNALELILEDLKMNTSQNLSLNPVYYFHASGNEDAGRFLLHFTSPIGINDQIESNPIRIFASRKTICISGNTELQNAEVNVYNLLGQEILTQKLSKQSLNQVTLNAPDGYYIIKVLTKSEVKTAKVNIMN